MRPKIRGFKPEMWTDEDFTEVSPFARLLWLGMWNFACDNGHLQDKSKQIKGRVLPFDNVNCAELLRELDDQGLIHRSDGWITIPNLAYHQKPHKSWWSTCDKPGCALPEGASRAPGNRGATVAKRGRNRSATAEVDVEGESDVEGEVNPLPDKSGQTPSRFDEFWDAYDHKVGRKKAEAAYRAAIKKPDVTDDLLIAAATQYVEWVKSEGKHPTFTKHPTTWLNGECWRDERVARQAPPTRVQQHLALAQKLAEEEDQMIPLPKQIGEGR